MKSPFRKAKTQAAPQEAEKTADTVPKAAPAENVVDELDKTLPALVSKRPSRAQDETKILHGKSALSDCFDVK